MSQTGELALLIVQKLGDPTNQRQHWGVPTNIPTPTVLTALFDVLFFASIKTEERRSIQGRIFYVNPSNPDPEAPPRIRMDRWQIFPLTSKVRFTVAAVAKLARTSVDPRPP